MDFNDILNECLDRLMNGETIEQCLSRFPEHADELKPLLETGSRIRKTAHIQPRPEFRAHARVQFHAAMNSLPQRKPETSFVAWLKQPLWAAVTTAALLVLLGTSTAVLANGSMPDQALYPVKLAMEKIQIALTPSAEAKGELYARLLERRIDEITRMTEENKIDKLQMLTSRLDSFAAEIGGAASRGGGEANDVNVAAPQATAVAPPSFATSPMAPAAGNTGPVAGSPPLGIAAAGGAENNTLPFTAPSSTVPGKAAPTEHLTVTDDPALQTAAANLAHLRDLLASAPDSAKPSLQDAINAAETVYAAVAGYMGNK